MGELTANARRLGAIGALAFAAAAADALGLLEFIERPLQNLRYRAVQRRASGAVVLVAIDSKSLQDMGAWPFSEKSFAHVVDSLTQAGARRVALAVTLPHSRPTKERVLEQALENAGGTVVIPEVEAPEEALLPTSWRSRSVPASANLVPDADGLIRRYALEDVVSGSTTPSLAAAMSLGVPPRGEAFYIDLGIDPDSIPRVSFADVLAHRYDPNLVKGKAVIVGVTAPEAANAVALATGRTLPTAVVHALALESLCRGGICTARVSS